MNQKVESLRKEIERLGGENFLFTPIEAAAAIGYAERTLAGWRLNNKGPRFITLKNRTVRYRKKDLIGFYKNQRFYDKKNRPIGRPRKTI